MPIDTRIQWDFYLNRFGSPSNRFERMIAMNTLISCGSKNARAEDFMLPVHQEFDEESEFDTAQTMLSQMVAHSAQHK